IWLPAIKAKSTAIALTSLAAAIGMVRRVDDARGTPCSRGVDGVNPASLLAARFIKSVAAELQSALPLRRLAVAFGAGTIGMPAGLLFVGMDLAMGAEDPAFGAVAGFAHAARAPRLVEDARLTDDLRLEDRLSCVRQELIAALQRHAGRA